MKTFRGIRDPGCRVVVLHGPDAAPLGAGASGDGDGLPKHDLAVPVELVTRPPGPFDWGGGAETPGTHYLAIALLAELLGAGDRVGIKALLPFLRRFLARLPQDGFEISDTVFYALFAAIATGGRADANPPPGHRPAAPGPGQPTADGRGERRTI